MKPEVRPKKKESGRAVFFSLALEERKRVAIKTMNAEVKIGVSSCIIISQAESFTVVHACDPRTLEAQVGEVRKV